MALFGEWSTAGLATLSVVAATSVWGLTNAYYAGKSYAQVRAALEPASKSNSSQAPSSTLKS